MNVSDEVVVGGIVAAVMGFVGWIVRLAARELLDGFRETMKEHGKSIDSLTKEVSEVRVEMAEFRARITALERQRE